MGLEDLNIGWTHFAAGAVLVAGLLYGCNKLDRWIQGDYDDRTECCEQLDCWFYKPICASTNDPKYFSAEDNLCITNSEGKKECCRCNDRNAGEVPIWLLYP
jgi:hypothetical protein